MEQPRTYLSIVASAILGIVGLTLVPISAVAWNIGYWAGLSIASVHLLQIGFMGAGALLVGLSISIQMTKRVRPIVATVACLAIASIALFSPTSTSIYALYAAPQRAERTSVQQAIWAPSHLRLNWRDPRADDAADAMYTRAQEIEKKLAHEWNGVNPSKREPSNQGNQGRK